MQCIVHCRRTSGIPETRHRSTEAQEVNIRSRRSKFLSADFKSDLAVKHHREGRATRFNAHADVHELLPLRQSAYCAHHSTETAVADVHNLLVRNVDRGDHVSALVLLDLGSAFNTVDHAILLDVPDKRFGIAEWPSNATAHTLAIEHRPSKWDGITQRRLSSTAVFHKASS